MLSSNRRVRNVGVMAYDRSSIAPFLLLGNSCTAYSPFYRLISIMNHNMTTIAVFGYKSLATHLTDVRFLLTVNE